MSNSRRNFLKLTGGVSAGLALGTIPATSLFSSCNNETGKVEKFGIQLYTVRDVLPKDPKGVMKQLASYGYKQFEGYEGELGLFWGMSHTDFKKYMDELGVEFVSSHCNTTQDFDKKAAQAAEIGMKYLINPYEGHDKSIEDYKRLADEFNTNGEVCKRNGIRFAFHNHEFSFKQLDGQFPQDVLVQNTDPALVDFEMDLYWVYTAGQDPETWLKKNPGRVKLCHVKNRIKDATERDATTDLSQGSIDYKKVLKTARENKVEYFIVEQERYDGSTSLKSAEANAKYMKDLKL